MPQQQRHLPPIGQADRRPGQHWQVQRASCRRERPCLVRPYDVEFVVEISRCRAPLHRSTTQAVRPAADVELYSATALYSSTALQRSTLYILYTLPQERPARWRSLYFMVSSSDRLTSQRQPSRASLRAGWVAGAAEAAHLSRSSHGHLSSYAVSGGSLVKKPEPHPPPRTAEVAPCPARRSRTRGVV